MDEGNQGQTGQHGPVSGPSLGLGRRAAGKGLGAFTGARQKTPGPPAIRPSIVAKDILTPILEIPLAVIIFAIFHPVRERLPNIPIQRLLCSSIHRYHSSISWP